MEKAFINDAFKEKLKPHNHQLEVMQIGVSLKNLEIFSNNTLMNYLTTPPYRC